MPSAINIYQSSSIKDEHLWDSIDSAIVRGMANSQNTVSQKMSPNKQPQRFATTTAVYSVQQTKPTTAPAPQLQPSAVVVRAMEQQTVKQPLKTELFDVIFYIMIKLQLNHL
jgi:hypothetical protein